MLHMQAKLNNSNNNSHNCTRDLFNGNTLKDNDLIIIENNKLIQNNYQNGYITSPQHSLLIIILLLLLLILIIIILIKIMIIIVFISRLIRVIVWIGFGLGYSFLIYFNLNLII